MLDAVGQAEGLCVDYGTTDLDITWIRNFTFTVDDYIT